MNPEEVAMAALADQVQAVIENSGYHVHTFMLVAEDGGREIRSQLPEDILKEVLIFIAEDFAENE